MHFTELICHQSVAIIAKRIPTVKWSLNILIKILSMTIILYNYGRTSTGLNLWRWPANPVLPYLSLLQYWWAFTFMPLLSQYIHHCLRNCFFSASIIYYSFYFFPSVIKKRGKVEEVQRKVGVVLLNGQKLELSCDIKAVCKDVLDMVVAHIGLVEHHLFGLAYLKGIVSFVCVSLWLKMRLCLFMCVSATHRGSA